MAPRGKKKKPEGGTNVLSSKGKGSIQRNWQVKSLPPVNRRQNSPLASGEKGSMGGGRIHNKKKHAYPPPKSESDSDDSQSGQSKYSKKNNRVYQGKKTTQFPFETKETNPFLKLKQSPCGKDNTTRNRPPSLKMVKQQKKGILKKKKSS